MQLKSDREEEEAEGAEEEEEEEEEATRQYSEHVFLSIQVKSNRQGGEGLQLEIVSNETSIKL